jgi:hypothetical protein
MTSQTSMPQAAADLRHFVGEPDVHHPKGVLEDFDHLGCGGITHRDDHVDDGREDHTSDLGQCSVDAADHLRGVAKRERPVGWVEALGCEREKEVLPDHETGSFEDRTEHLLGGPGVAGAGEHDELARPLARDQRLAHRFDGRGVRLTLCCRVGCARRCRRRRGHPPR